MSMFGSRMGAVTRMVLPAMCACVAGCSAISYRESPGPQPAPVPTPPGATLRAVLPRGDAGEVVLDASDGLSPDEAALMAIDQNPRLTAARTQHGIAEAQLLAAGVLPNPRFDGSIDLPVSGPDATVLGYGAGVSWDVSPLLSRSQRVSAARESLRSIDLDVAWQEWQVAQAARLHVIRAIYFQKRVRLAHEVERTWRRRLTALSDARAAGAASDVDVSTARRSLRDAQADRLELERQLRSERADLNLTLGVDAESDVTLDTLFAVSDSTPSSEDLLDELPQRRLDLVALQHAHASHDAASRAAAMASFPPVSLGLHTGRDVDRAASVGVVVAFDFPFFDRNQAEISRQSALKAQVDAEYDSRLAQARSDVVRTEAELDAVWQELVAARDESAAVARLADELPVALAQGVLSPMTVEETVERSLDGRLRVLELEQSVAELQIALAVASGRDVR